MLDKLLQAYPELSPNVIINDQEKSEFDSMTKEEQEALLKENEELKKKLLEAQDRIIKLMDEKMGEGE